MSLPFELPVLSLGGSLAYSLVIGSSYVASLYLFNSSRLVFARAVRPDPTRAKDAHERQRVPGERWRNDPSVIRARLTAVSLSTLSCCALVYWLVWRSCHERHRDLALRTTIELLGFPPEREIVRAHLLTPLLYAGPLYVSYLERTLPFQARWSWRSCVRPIYATWEGARNIIMGPITEELTFRSCVVAVLLLGKWKPGRIIFAAPLSFGVAHAHHAWDLYNRFGRTRAALKRAVLTCVIQLAYTTIFGAFCTFLLLRTGSVLPAIGSHMFCNLYGLPAPSAAAEEHPHRRIRG
ncbi:hypothetical protein AURDEDRAFT_61361 [Auricularia subglabra TFB-10046 SS5]|nr:hypothetical protein AURDEDRAFT_61361 [Auricularia subglabra TFB-10046 SS5]